MARIIVAAFIAIFIAAVAAIVGVPALAQISPANPPAVAAPTPEGVFRTQDEQARNARERVVALDTDHDGRISRAEWLAGGRHERGFDFMDTDHDGYLSVDELRAGREKAMAMREARGKQ